MILFFAFLTPYPKLQILNLQVNSEGKC